jgi:acetyl-CoA acetyltransferase
MTNAFRDQTAIVGVGHSPCSKDLGVPAHAFTLATCLEAIADAGLEPGDIDGIAAMGGDGEPSTLQMMEMLGLPGVNWYGGMLGGGVGPSVVAQAALAVASGVCDTALAYRTMTAPRPGAATYNYMGAMAGASGTAAFTLPYGLGVFMQYFAPWYQRRRKLDGVTDEQMGAYVVAMRDNASRNPHAALGKPITLDEYVESRYVCEPLRLFDCDLPVDVCGAVVVTSAERAKDLPNAPVYVAGVSTGTGPRPDMIFWHDYDESAYAWAGRRIWDVAGLGPSDMDFAMMYDGFAPLVLYGLEEFGLVAKGEAGAFLGAGEHLSTGRLPLNPHGGNNSEGRSHAIGHVVEAALQLRGDAGERQLPDVHATIINGGAITLSGALVLHNRRGAQ